MVLIIYTYTTPLSSSMDASILSVCEPYHYLISKAGLRGISYYPLIITPVKVSMTLFLDKSIAGIWTMEKQRHILLKIKIHKRKNIKKNYCKINYLRKKYK